MNNPESQLLLVVCVLAMMTVAAFYIHGAGKYRRRNEGFSSPPHNFGIERTFQ
jgi:hypothetical protein